MRGGVRGAGGGRRQGAAHASRVTHALHARRAPVAAQLRCQRCQLLTPPWLPHALPSPAAPSRLHAVRPHTLRLQNPQPQTLNKRSRTAGRSRSSRSACGSTSSCSPCTSCSGSSSFCTACPWWVRLLLALQSALPSPPPCPGVPGTMGCSSHCWHVCTCVWVPPPPSKHAHPLAPDAPCLASPRPALPAPARLRWRGELDQGGFHAVQHIHHVPGARGGGRWQGRGARRVVRFANLVRFASWFAWFAS